jgi:aryl carrier-like protein
VTGGIYIGGEGVTRGYAGRPDLTSEKFLPDPFSDAAGARMYDTGDLGRYSPNGTVEFLGRSDHQVKIRGYRIELEEIEAALIRHPAVREVVVAPLGDVDDKKLVAYIVSESDVASHDELRGFLKEKLPEYMLPSVFVRLNAMPLTPNGKINRQALPSPDAARPELKASYQAPRSKLESAIAEVWHRALNVERVGMHDNFFDLGGHSLLMAQVHSQLKEIHGRDLPLIKLLEHPTISSLAKYLKGEEDAHLSVEQNYSRAQKQMKAIGRQRESFKARLGF